MVVIQAKKLIGKASFVGEGLFHQRMTGSHEQWGKVIISNVPEEKKMEK